jgi:hypothetical protein
MRKSLVVGIDKNTHRLLIAEGFFTHLLVVMTRGASVLVQDMSLFIVDLTIAPDRLN